MLFIYAFIPLPQLRLPPCLSVGHSWHTLACEYPSPAQVKAVVFGGTCSNMFSGPESELLFVNKTLVLEFGKVYGHF